MKFHEYFLYVRGIEGFTDEQDSPPVSIKPCCHSFHNYGSDTDMGECIDTSIRRSTYSLIGAILSHSTILPVEVSVGSCGKCNPANELVLNIGSE